MLQSQYLQIRFGSCYHHVGIFLWYNSPCAFLQICHPMLIWLVVFSSISPLPKTKLTNTINWKLKQSIEAKEGVFSTWDHASLLRSGSMKSNISYMHFTNCAMIIALQFNLTVQFRSNCLINRLSTCKVALPTSISTPTLLLYYLDLYLFLYSNLTLHKYAHMCAGFVTQTFLFPGCIAIYVFINLTFFIW